MNIIQARHWRHGTVMNESTRRLIAEMERERLYQASRPETLDEMVARHRHDITKPRRRHYQEDRG